MSEFTAAQTERRSIVRAMLSRKTTLIWPIIAGFGASVFYIAVIGLAGVLAVAVWHALPTSARIADIVSSWSIAFGGCLAAHIVLQSAMRLLLWREASNFDQTGASRSWFSDLCRVLSIEAIFAVIQTMLWVCQIAAWLGIFAKKSAICVVIAGSSAAFLLLCSLARRACLAQLWREESGQKRSAAGVLAAIGRGMKSLCHRPFNALACLICPKIAFFAFGIAAIAAIKLQLSDALIVLAAAGMLISRQIEPFLQFKRADDWRAARQSEQMRASV